MIALRNFLIINAFHRFNMMLRLSFEKLSSFLSLPSLSTSFFSRRPNKFPPFNLILINYGKKMVRHFFFFFFFFYVKNLFSEKLAFSHLSPAPSGKKRDKIEFFRSCLLSCAASREKWTIFLLKFFCY